MTDQPAVEIRHVDAEEVEAFTRAMTVTFLEDTAGVARSAALTRRDWQPERSWGAFADGRIVGTLRTIPRQLSVPGLNGPNGSTFDVSADALTNVTVAATHRRRGLLRQMLTASLDAAKDRGDPVSILIAAEWTIYGRFGYWPAATWANSRIDTRRRGATLRGPVTGTVRQVDAEELRTLAPAVFDVARRARAGQISRSEAQWDGRLLPEFRDNSERERIGIVHEGEQGVDGFLTWYPTADFELEHGGAIEVGALFATDQPAYTALWGYLLGMDGVDGITITHRPLDEPLPFLLTDGRSVQLERLTDSMWVRLLDVPAALSARRYSTSGRVCLEVVDDDIGRYAAGRYTLDGGPDGADCHPTSTESPDLRLSQRALAAVYLGQPSLFRQASAGYVEELTPGALARADAMFTTPLLPWVGTEF